MKKFARHIGRLFDSNSGAAMVEFGIIINLFIGLIFCTILWGIWLWEYNTLQHATMQAARCSILPTPSGTAGKRCTNTNTHGVNSTYAVNPATPTTAATAFTEQNTSTYKCVTANYTSGFTSFTSTLFFFRDNPIKPKICYTIP